MSKKSKKRPWRKLIKKLQRKRKRRKFALERDKQIEDAATHKLQDPMYKSWLEEQAIIKQKIQEQQENERQEQEEMWLRRELLAQKQFKIDELKRKALEAEEEAERLKQKEELRLKEEARENKRKAINLQAEKAAQEFDEIMTYMQSYLDNPVMKTPTRLLMTVESRPGEQVCEFFEKTNCCRFDPLCSFNHKRPILAKIIIIKHFFQHPLLEQQEHEEYSRSDSDLELCERDLRDAYDEFCEDVWPVLEEFGNILNFRTVRNTHAHLRGHVFVEYAQKRSALKAFINLQNRYYALKRLNVQFCNIKQWHKAVCGMRFVIFKGLSLGRKCPKGDKCNYLHIMKNANNKYNQPIHNGDRLLPNVSFSTKTVLETPAPSWDIELKRCSVRSHNWRWSESPEVDIKNSREYGENKNEIPTTSLNKYGSISSCPNLAKCKLSGSSGSNTDRDESIEHKKNRSYNRLSGSKSSSPNCPNKKSSSRYKDYDKPCKHRSKSPDKSKTHKSSKSNEYKLPKSDTKYSKADKSTSHKNSKSKQQKSPHKELSSPVPSTREKIKRGKSKSPTSRKKRKKNRTKDKEKNPHRQ